MNVVTDRGLQVGKLHDILVDEQSGKITSLVVRPAEKTGLQDVPKDELGNALIPFSSVMAMRDYIVINERALMLQQLKRRPERPPEGGEVTPPEKAPQEPQLL